MSYNPILHLQESQCTNIYEALDSNNPRKALLECNKLLSSPSTTFPLVISLKSLALIRTNNLKEASTICDQLLDQSNPPNSIVLDQNSLIALGMTLDKLGRSKEILPLLETATKVHSGNQDLWAKYFKRLLKEAEWMKAQQVSLKLFKLFNNQKYFWWSIQSYIILSNSPSSPGSSLSLPLSTRMISSHLKTFPLNSNSDQVLHLYCSVLVKQKLFKEALEVLNQENSRGICKRDMGLELVREDCLKASDMWEQVWEESRGKIEGGDRNWATLLSLISSALKLHLRNSSSTQIESTIQLLSLLLSTSPVDRSLRLAQLELSKLIKTSVPNNSESFKSLNSLHQLCVKYFEDLGSKPCGFEDLKPYVSVLEKDEKVEFRKLMERKEGSEIKDSKDLSLLINEEKFKRVLKVEISEEGEIEDAKRLAGLYFKGLKFGSHLPLTEMQPSDDLALLAAHCLIAASSVSTSPQSHLLSALSLLNFATKKSPKGYQLRILSIRIFKLLGCFGQALEHYNQVGIKALQFDTLSHLILERGEMFGGEMTEGDKEKGKSKANGKKTRKSKVEEKIEDSMQIYESNEKETMSVIGRAFDLGTYSRIEEFVDFHSRLDRSINKQILTLEKLRVSLSSKEFDQSKLEEMKKIVKKVDEDLKKGESFDQRDFTVIPSYQPVDERVKSIDELTSMGKKTGNQWVNLSLQIAALACGVEIEEREMSSQEELTEAEVSLSKIVKLLRSSEKGKPFSDGQSSAVVSFFKERETSVTSSSPDTLPWKMIHEAHIALEAYNLLSILSRSSQLESISSTLVTVLPSLKSISSNFLSRSQAASSSQSRDLLLSQSDWISNWHSIAGDEAKKISNNTVKKVGDESGATLNELGERLGNLS